MSSLCDALKSLNVRGLLQQIDADGLSELPSAQLSRCAAATSKHLANAGVKQDDLVVISMPNCIQQLSLVFACSKLHAAVCIAAPEAGLLPASDADSAPDTSATELWLSGVELQVTHFNSHCSMNGKRSPTVWGCISRPGVHDTAFGESFELAVNALKTGVVHRLLLVDQNATEVQQTKTVESVSVLPVETAAHESTSSAEAKPVQLASPRLQASLAATSDDPWLYYGSSSGQLVDNPSQVVCRSQRSILREAVAVAMRTSSITPPYADDGLLVRRIIKTSIYGTLAP